MSLASTGKRQARPTFNPRQKKWARHFRWDGAYLVGITAIGRATIVVLAINDPDYVDFRRH